MRKQLKIFGFRGRNIGYSQLEIYCDNQFYTQCIFPYRGELIERPLKGILNPIISFLRESNYENN